MWALYPSLPIATATVLFSVFGAHALRLKGEGKYREAWGAATLAVLPAAVFWLIVVSGDFDVLRRSLLLIPAGAVVGACLFVWLGYVLHDWTAKAKSNSAATMTQDQNPKSSPSIRITGGNNVFSFGQLGGQTAHTIINQGSSPRAISDAAAQQLINGLTPPDGKKPKIIVDCANDGKSTQYAEKWESILRAAKWDVTTGASIISSPPLVGIRIAVGSADTVGAAQLQKAFSLLGEQAIGELDPTLHAGEIRLKIGTAL
jgi:hypothetical protein